MILPTTDIVDALIGKGFVSDGGQPYGYVGYSSGNGEWVVLDEQYAYQDTNQLIEDCVANECYSGAAIIKDLTEKKR